MTVYSTQFFSGALVQGQHVLYTVPANETVVLRDIELYGNIATTAQVSLSVLLSGVLSSIVYYVKELEPGLWTQWTGRAVLEQGQELASNSEIAGPMCLVSGYLLGN
jgi:hypothetical protein